MPYQYCMIKFKKIIDKKINVWYIKTMKVYKKIDPMLTIPHIRKIRACLSCSLYEAKTIIDQLKLTDKPVEILDIIDVSKMSSNENWETDIYGRLVDSGFIIDEFLTNDIDKFFEI